MSFKNVFRWSVSLKLRQQLNVYDDVTNYVSFDADIRNYTGSRLERVRLQRAPGYNELIVLHQNHWQLC